MQTIYSFEEISNILQMLITFGMAIFLVIKAPYYKKALIVYFMAGVLFCTFLGDIFWTLHIILLNGNPSFFTVSDIAWFGGYFFIMEIEMLIDQPKTALKWWGWLLLLVIPVNMVIWIINTGSIVMNVLWALLMEITMWYTLRRLTATINNTDKRQYQPFYVSIIAFLIMQILLFISVAQIYALCDLLVTVSILLMGSMLMKGVKQDNDLF